MIKITEDMADFVADDIGLNNLHSAMSIRLKHMRELGKGSWYKSGTKDPLTHKDNSIERFKNHLRLAIHDERYVDAANYLMMIYNLTEKK